MVTPDEDVSARSAGEKVLPRVANQDIITIAALDVIVAVAAINDILASATLDYVISGLAVDNYRQGDVGDRNRVVAVATTYGDAARTFVFIKFTHGNAVGRHDHAAGRERDQVVAAH